MHELLYMHTPSTTTTEWHSVVVIFLQRHSRPSPTWQAHGYQGGNPRERSFSTRFQSPFHPWEKSWLWLAETSFSFSYNSFFPFCKINLQKKRFRGMYDERVHTYLFDDHNGTSLHCGHFFSVLRISWSVTFSNHVYTVPFGLSQGSGGKVVLRLFFRFVPGG